jgi:hypothetical protein
MNTTTAVAPVITAANEALRRDFPLRPFAIRHRLAGHPLLSLPRITQLAAELPRDLIEYNSGEVAISQDPDAIPSVDLDPVEIVERIETAGAWMVLKRVENSPDYRALLQDTLLSVARARGFNGLADAGFEQVEGFLFVSSPNSTTPFHLDSEDNFFVHIHGEKFFTIYDNTDRSLFDDAEIERSMTKHRNLKFDERFAPRATEFHLFAGDGCYVPISGRTGCAPPAPIRSRWRSPGKRARSAATTTCTSSIHGCVASACRSSHPASSRCGTR